MSSDMADKAEKALRAVRTLAGKARDPSLIIDALGDLVAASMNASVEESKIQLYKKVADQCRKMDHLSPEDFRWDTVDRQITEGLARFSKIKRNSRCQSGEDSGAAQGGESCRSTVRQQAGQGVEMLPPAPPPYLWAPYQYQSPIPAYHPPPPPSPVVMSGPGVEGDVAERVNRKHATAAEKRAISWTSVRN